MARHAAGLIQSGQAKAAERMLKDILRAEPGQFDALLKGRQIFRQTHEAKLREPRAKTSPPSFAATGAVSKLTDDALKAYSDLREVARTELKDETSLTALSESNARSAYTAPRKAEYRGRLKKLGFGHAELKNEIDALDDLRTADGLQTRLIGAAQQATDDRNDAVRPLRE